MIKIISSNQKIFKIPELNFPESVEISQKILPEERERNQNKQSKNRQQKKTVGSAFHEKSNKNSKENLGGKYKREIKNKYKKSRTRGDKGQNIRKKK